MKNTKLKIKAFVFQLFLFSFIFVFSKLDMCRLIEHTQAPPREKLTSITHTFEMTELIVEDSVDDNSSNEPEKGLN